DFVVALGIALRLEAECKVDRVSYLTKSLGYGHARLGCKFLGDLLFEAVVALDPVLEAFQPAAMPILLLEGPHVRRDGRPGPAPRVDGRACFGVPLGVQEKPPWLRNDPGGSAERS